MDVNKLFEEIHDVYQSHDGGAIHLDEEKEAFIKGLLSGFIRTNQKKLLIEWEKKEQEWDFGEYDSSVEIQIEEFLKNQNQT